MNSGYLYALDEIIAGGLTAFSPATIGRHLAFVRERQQADGGFPGRRGGSDPYYTDFALRLLHGEDAVKARAGTYLVALPGVSGELVDLFNRLHAAWLIGLPPPCPASDLLAQWRLPPGGFARPGAGTTSAYRTFLAALCCELLDLALPAAGLAVAAIRNLRQADGGFVDTVDEAGGQTNATAAALAFLRMHDALKDETAGHAIRFLTRMQGRDGGLRAHARADESDLLSTFTGLLTLLGLDAAGEIDLPAIGRFARDAALPGGGFGACPGDDEADIEYTYYGLGTLALLRAHLASRG